MAAVTDEALPDEKNIQSTGNELTNGDTSKDVFAGKVVQVTNVSPGATLQQMATLFGFLGTVTDIRLYPTEESAQVAVKICYIKYENSEQCGVAQHLTNTVFIDKALIVVPISREEIPEESECLHLVRTLNAYASMANTDFLPQAFPVEETASSIPGLPPPPVITTSVDPVEIEEIRRTIFVENIHESITSEQLMAFFSGVGEVKYLRLVKKKDATKYAFVEFSAVESVPTALQYNGVLFGNNCLKVVHAKSPISKPESERIASGRTPVRKYVEARKPSLERFTSRSPARHRSRTKSPRRRRSRTRSPRRRRSRSPRRRKSRSPPPRRSTSRSKKRSKSHSRSRSPKRRKSRSRSRERRRRRKSPSRSISRSPKRKSKKKSKSRSPLRRKSRKSVSRSPDRTSNSRRKKKDKDKDKEKNKDSSSKEENDTEKELDHLLTKIQNYEEEQKKAQEPGDEPKKKKKKDSS